MKLLCLWPCLLTGYLQALKFRRFKPQSLMMLGETERVIGILFHSVDLERSMTELIVLMGSRWYPFKAFYESQCKDGIDLARYRELILVEDSEARKLLLSAECVRRSQVTIGGDDIELIPESILRTSKKMPAYTSRGAFIRSVYEMLSSKNMNMLTCKWLFGTHVQTLGKDIDKLDQFWLFFHPACYIRELPTDYREEHKILMDNQQIQTGKYLLRRYRLMEGATDLPQLLRWVCQVSMVGIQLKRSFPVQRASILDVEITLMAIRDEIDLHAAITLLNNFEREHLMGIRKLLTGVLQVISAVPEVLEHKHAMKPSFKSLLGLIMGSAHGPEIGSIALLNHWKLQLCLLFMEVYNSKDSSEIERVLDDLKDAPPELILPLDIFQLSEYLFEYFVTHDTLIFDIVLKHAENHDDLQRYLLTVLNKRYTNRFPPYKLPGRLSFLLGAIPASVRMSLVRELAFSCYQGSPIDQIRLKHYRWYRTCPDQSVEQMMTEFFALNNLMTDEEGRIRILDPFWTKATLKSFGYMCALSVLYGVHLPVHIYAAQLKLLLGFDLWELHRLRSSGDASGIFPNSGKDLTSDPEAAGMKYLERSVVVMTAFRSTVRFTVALSWEEVLNILVPLD